MTELLVALDAFVQEHRRCGELDGGVDGERVWMACACGADIVHSDSGGCAMTGRWPCLARTTFYCLLVMALYGCGREGTPRFQIVQGADWEKNAPKRAEQQRDEQVCKAKIPANLTPAEREQRELDCWLAVQSAKPR